MNLMVNPTITGFRQEVNGTIKELKLGEAKEDAYANIVAQGSSDLENNKAATINVSTYTEPVVVNPTSGKDGMKKATVTLTNIPEPSDLENNKEVNIDGANYTRPVEITPTSGKDGMKKVTVTLTNNRVTFYSWYNETAHKYCYTMSETPSRSDKAYFGEGEFAISTSTPSVVFTYDPEENTIGINNEETPVIYTRASSDIFFDKRW